MIKWRLIYSEALFKIDLLTVMNVYMYLLNADKVGTQIIQQTCWNIRTSTINTA